MWSADHGQPELNGSTRKVFPVLQFQNEVLVRRGKNNQIVMLFTFKRKKS